MIKLLRKFPILAVAFITAMALAACSDDEPSNGGSDSPDAGSTVLNASTRPAKPKGYGDSGSPFEIENAGQLLFVIESVNDGTFHPIAHDYTSDSEKETMENQIPIVSLKCDITVESNYSWRPIGNFTHPFRGEFRGNGHTISGTLAVRDLQTETSTSDTFTGILPIHRAGLVGFFGCAEGKISNLKIDATYTSEGNHIYLCFGGIAAYSSIYPLTDCEFSGSYATPAGLSGKEVRIGGIVGNGISAVINRCTNSGTLDFSAENAVSGRTLSSETLCIGGIVGRSDVISIGECINHASLTLDHIIVAQVYIGGIIGRGGEDVSSNFDINENRGAIKISNVRAYTSDLEQALYVGGLLGYGRLNGWMSKSYNYASIDVTSRNIFAYVGGIGGSAYSAGVKYPLGGTNEGDVRNDSPLGVTGGCFGSFGGEGTMFANSGHVISTAERTDAYPMSGATAGIVGCGKGPYAYFASLTNCHNAGDVDSPAPYDSQYGLISYAGAILGYEGTFSSTDMINTGTINGVSFTDRDAICFLGYAWLGLQRLIDLGNDYYESPEGEYWRQYARWIYR